MKSREIRDRFLEVVGEVPEIAKEILADKGAGARMRWDVSKDLMDRFGFPAVKATLNQNLTGTADIEQLLKARNELAEEQQRLLVDLREVQQQLSAPAIGDESDATNQEGKQGSEGDAENVRVKEGEEGVLRINQCGEDQGGTQDEEAKVIENE